MQIIDIGEAFYVVEQIAYVSIDTDAFDKFRIKIALAGNSALFAITFNSKEDRDKAYKEIRKIILNYKCTKDSHD